MITFLFYRKNKEITLQDFKWIWRMEYYHRMWGRFIGLAYLLPAAYFLKKDMIFPCYYKRVGFMGLLIFAQVSPHASSANCLLPWVRALEVRLHELCFQGLMGWYMVKSGLEDRFDGPNDVPRVSQYRLAAHLSFAFVLYASLLRSALELLSPALQWPVMSKSIVPFKIMAHSSKGLVYLTAISGKRSKFESRIFKTVES